MLDFAYRWLRPLLFSLDAETAHELVMWSLPLVPLFAGSREPDPVLRVRVAGLDWAGPVGLAAGLDKNGVGIRAWAALGFGAVEVGTVTAHAQPGNPRPRLFRLEAERGLINRMGFNNQGAVALAATLARLRDSGHWPRVPVGVNLGKSKLTPDGDAVGDYLNSVGALRGKADYFVVNVSSPNTPGLRALQDREPLRALLDAVVPASQRTPVLLKVAPDLDDDALGAAAGRVPVIGVGGVSTADDALRYLRMGCAAVQLYTALIYEGPGLVARIHADLADRAKAAGSLQALVRSPTDAGAAVGVATRPGT